MTAFLRQGEDNKPSFFSKLRSALQSTKRNWASRFEELLSGQAEVDEALLSQLEDALIAGDVGLTTTQEVMEEIRREAQKGLLRSGAELQSALQSRLLALLERGANRTLQQSPVPSSPWVVLLVGVNGSGKTTTAGKLAWLWSQQGKRVLLCAGDTFRAAAGDQLAVWAERSSSDLIQQKPGADPSAVVFDALTAAKARGYEVVIGDTAGRLHNKTNLMTELEKIRRTCHKVISGSPHEVLLVIDSTTGQNGLQQARVFTQSAGVTGIVLTKLDGTAKGGIVLAIARELALPIRYVGVGEQREDLLPFDPQQFVESLFATRPVLG